MNKIVLLGKLIKDPELKTIENGEKSFTRFIIAVDRNFKSAPMEQGRLILFQLLYGEGKPKLYANI